MLEEHIELIESLKYGIANIWTESELVISIVDKKLIDVEKFKNQYAIGVIEYFLSVLKKRKTRGDCPVMHKMLHDFAQAHITSEEIFIICAQLKRTLINFSFENHFATQENIDQINSMLDANFGGVIRAYDEIVHEYTKRLEEQGYLIEEQYFYDELTGLKNINSIRKDIDDSKNSILMLIDINRLHEINESYGYKSGDKVLFQMATFLSSLFQPYQAEVYRFVGDQYGVLFKENENIELDIHSLVKVLQNTLLVKHFDISEKDLEIDITIQATVGIAQTGDLLVAASSALHSAKLRNISYIVHEELDSNLENNIEKIQKLYKAIENSQIIAYFQPIVNNKTKKISKYETLVRMLDEDNNVLSPIAFLEASKKSHLYQYLTKIVLEQAFNTFDQSPLSFSINIEMSDILNPITREIILNMVEIFSEPNRIVFELVESEIINDEEIVYDFLKSLKDYGCKLAIDDFGTGFSNFEYLLRIKADIIKIDGSLIKDLNVNEEKRAIVRSIVAFAQDIGIETVAEYVENEEIFNIVKDMGITYSQGYYFAKPMPVLR